VPCDAFCATRLVAIWPQLVQIRLTKRFQHSEPFVFRDRDLCRRDCVDRRHESRAFGNGSEYSLGLLSGRSAQRDVGKHILECGAFLSGIDAEFVERLHVFAVERTARGIIERRVDVGDVQPNSVPLCAH
jgi:hypothetical protein